MPTDRVERLKALAGWLDGQGRREDAHDLRNMLGVVVACKAAARTEADECDRLRKAIAEILNPGPLKGEGG